MALIAADLVATLGWERADAERHAHREALNVALFDGGAIRVVEEVQQWLHDTFLDTTWPSCPDHHTHPLWLHGDGGQPAWTCHTTGRRVCSLGDLGSVAAVDAAVAEGNRQRLRTEEQWVEQMTQRFGARGFGRRPRFGRRFGRGRVT